MATDDRFLESGGGADQKSSLIGDVDGTPSRGAVGLRCTTTSRVNVVQRSRYPAMTSAGRLRRSALSRSAAINAVAARARSSRSARAGRPEANCQHGIGHRSRSEDRLGQHRDGGRPSGVAVGSITRNAHAVRPPEIRRASGGPVRRPSECRQAVRRGKTGRHPRHLGLRRDQIGGPGDDADSQRMGRNPLDTTPLPPRRSHGGPRRRRRPGRHPGGPTGGPAPARLIATSAVCWGGSDAITDRRPGDSGDRRASVPIRLDSASARRPTTRRFPEGWTERRVTPAPCREAESATSTVPQPEFVDVDAAQIPAQSSEQLAEELVELDGVGQTRFDTTGGHRVEPVSTGDCEGRGPTARAQQIPDDRVLTPHHGTDESFGGGRRIGGHGRTHPSATSRSRTRTRCGPTSRDWMASSSRRSSAVGSSWPRLATTRARQPSSQDPIG